MPFSSSPPADFTTRVRSCCEPLSLMCTSPSGLPCRPWSRPTSCSAGGPECALARSLPGPLRLRPLSGPSRFQKITDLGEQFHLARRLGRLGRLGGFPLLQPRQSPNHEEQHRRDNQEIDDDREEVAPREYGSFFLCVRQSRGGNLRRQPNEVVREVEPASDRADD